MSKQTKTAAAHVAEGNAERLTLEQLRAKTAAAFRDYHDDGRRLVGILDAVEDDMSSLMRECNCWGNFAHPYNDRADLLALIGDDPETCFTAGRFAYAFNPVDPDNHAGEFCDSHKYIAIDGYGHLSSIRDRECLACWYAANISDYLYGNYGEQSADALQALAEVFGADYDGEEEGGEE